MSKKRLQEPIERKPKNTIKVKQEIVDSHIYRPIYVTNFHDDNIYDYEEYKYPDDDGSKGERLRSRLETLNKRAVNIQNQMFGLDHDSDEYKALQIELEEVQKSRESHMNRIAECKQSPVYRFTSMRFGQREGNVHKVSYRRYTPRDNRRKKRRKLVKIGYLQ